VQKKKKKMKGKGPSLGPTFLKEETLRRQIIIFVFVVPFAFKVNRTC
jgi:hypothetical protein